MKTKLLALALLAGGSMFAQTRFSVGVGIGPAYPEPAYAYRMARPGPDFVWVEGYWARTGWRNHWVPGYWMRRPYRSGYVAPRYDNGRYYDGRYNDGRYNDGRYYDNDRGYDRNGYRR